MTTLEKLDAWIHSHPAPGWFKQDVCDALDLSVGMATADFLHNDGRAPSWRARLLSFLR